ncbi:hypothetical protein [Streptomyces sp. 1222.5]|uniref:hypothetical protein n=1 Tax=Streptomyces sp. 1222.5 TaxID=1881026 RepID=UPI003D74AFFF
MEEEFDSEIGAPAQSDEVSLDGKRISALRKTKEGPTVSNFTNIENVVIFGDSMSDIGRKCTTFWGKLGMWTKQMLVNEAGRFSDGRNWSDFLIQWATGHSLLRQDAVQAMSTSIWHMGITANSKLRVMGWSWDNIFEKERQPHRGTLYNRMVDILSVNLNTKPTDDNAIADSLKQLDSLKANLDQVVEEDTEELPSMGTSNEGKMVGFVNYAMGGALAAPPSEWPTTSANTDLMSYITTFYALSFLDDQVAQYCTEIEGPIGRENFSQPTLFIIFIGLNDFATCKRVEYTRDAWEGSPKNYGDYGKWLAWKPPQEKTIEGIFPSVDAIRRAVESIEEKAPAGSHYLLIDLPSNRNAIRYVDGISTDRQYVAQSSFVQSSIKSFNALLAGLVSYWKADVNSGLRDRVHLCQMSMMMDYVTDDLSRFKLRQEAQPPKEVPTNYPESFRWDSAPPQARKAVNTSDEGHPTEAVYELMAQYVVNSMLENGLTFGRLDEFYWPQLAPYKDAPWQFPYTGPAQLVEPNVESTDIRHEDE